MTGWVIRAGRYRWLLSEVSIAGYQLTPGLSSGGKRLGVRCFTVFTVWYIKAQDFC